MRRLCLLMIGLALFSSCIDRINIVVPDSNVSQLVVDGLITDEQGPYTVKLSLASSIDGFLQFSKPISAKRITLFDNAGNAEVFEEIEIGTFQTKPNGMQGVIGREYFIRIETVDGKIYESLPDRMNPVGSVDSLYYEFESYKPLNEQTQYGFRFFADGSGLPDGDNLVRWKFISVFELDTDPKLRLVPCPGGAACSCQEPPKCSGWIVGTFGLVPVGDCTCCTCWVTRQESQPHVGDDQFTAQRKAKKVEVGCIPLDYFPFLKGKNRAEVKQMSLSPAAYDYWKIIQSQKEGAASLFQPPTGKTITTIFEKNGKAAALGIFYASAVKKRQLYLTNADVPVKFSRVPFWDCEQGTGKIPQSCLLAYPFSSNKPPADWK